MVGAVMRAAVPLVSCFLVTDAVRLGDMDVEEATTNSSGDFNKYADYLVKKFGDDSKFPETRETLKKIREPEMQGGSKGSDRKYQYLGTKCMQERLTWSAKEFKKAGCKRILEVGGFRTPMPSVVSKEEIPNVELYVDVDPSADETKKETFDQNFPSVTLQILLDEFRAKRKDDAKHQGELFDCFLMLGTTAQNVGDDKSKKALKDAVSKAKLAIIEFPSSNTDTPGHFMPSMQDSGLTVDTKHVVDCTGDEESKKKADPKCENAEGGSCLKRNIILFKRGDSKSKKSLAEGQSEVEE